MEIKNFTIGYKLCNVYATVHMLRSVETFEESKSMFDYIVQNPFKHKPFTGYNSFIVLIYDENRGEILNSKRLVRSPFINS